MWHWRRCTPQSFWTTRQSSHGRGTCSVCCLSGCCSDRVPNVGLAETSWCVGTICSKKASGKFSAQRQPESPNLFSASETSTLEQRAKAACVQQGSAPQAQRSLQELRKRCMNSKTDDRKCNNLLFQSRFLSTNPSNQPVSLDRSKFFASLRSTTTIFPGPGGCTCEHLKILLDDTDTTELLMSACNILAQGRIPANIKNAML